MSDYSTSPGDTHIARYIRTRTDRSHKVKPDVC